MGEPIYTIGKRKVKVKEWLMYLLSGLIKNNKGTCDMKIEGGEVRKIIIEFEPSSLLPLVGMKKGRSKRSSEQF